MKVYRGLKDIAFSNIDPFYINGDDHTYGNGTSYAKERSLAEEYCNSMCVKNFGWILTYDYQPKNPFYVSESNFVDLESFGSCTKMIYKDQVISSKDLADLLRNDGYDCAVFEYDENDAHVMILSNNNTLTLEEIELFTENQEIVDLLNSLKISNDGTNFIIKYNDLGKIDQLLTKFL